MTRFELPWRPVYRYTREEQERILRYGFRSKVRPWLLETLATIGRITTWSAVIVFGTMTVGARVITGFMVPTENAVPAIV